MKFDLEQFIFALSDTVDLVGIDEILHSKRVAYLAWTCSESLGFSKKRQRKLFHLGLLHDLGVSSTAERRNLIDELEWENSNIHCIIGADRLQYFDPLSSFAPAILHHHTRWEILEKEDLTDEIKIEANLIYLLDRIDYLCQITPGPSWISKKDVVRNRVNRFRGKYFQPELIDGFLEASDNEAFWFSLEPLMLMDFFDRQKREQQDICISFDQLETVAELFAQVVDAKSAFTAEHSIGVAKLSRFLAEKAGLEEKNCIKVEIAGLLHDLGKLQVPDRVLENPGPLLGDDLTSMRHHSYVTYRILNKITGLEEIAVWAGNHHEALDGSGYPFRRTADELSIESRIIAIADIFQALAQKRPYREAKPLENILSFLHQNAEKGRLDTSLVEVVMDNSDICYQTATDSLPSSIV